MLQRTPHSRAPSVRESAMPRSSRNAAAPPSWNVYRDWRSNDSTKYCVRGATVATRFLAGGSGTGGRGAPRPGGPPPPGGGARTRAPPAGRGGKTPMEGPPRNEKGKDNQGDNAPG